MPLLFRKILKPLGYNFSLAPLTIAFGVWLSPLPLIILKPLMFLLLVVIYSSSSISPKYAER